MVPQYVFRQAYYGKPGRQFDCLHRPQHASAEAEHVNGSADHTLNQQRAGVPFSAFSARLHLSNAKPFPQHW